MMSEINVYLQPSMTFCLTEIGCFGLDSWLHSTRLPQPGVVVKAFGTTQENQRAEDRTANNSYAEEFEAEDRRNEILQASLTHVSAHGWSTRALAAGAESVGYPGVAHGMFPRGGVELVLYFEERCNMKHESMLAEIVKEGMDRKAFMCTAVEKRLRMIIPFIEHWAQAQGLLATPENVMDAVSILTEISDNVWYHAGDRSTDFNWYTKRVSLGAAYKATELTMLQDTSKDFKDTWEFLERRIENLQTFGGLVRQLQEITPVCAGALITARNILGIANTRR